MRKRILNKNGEGYVDMCVGVIVFVMILVIAINIFAFITLRVEMDQIADELIECATYNGSFGTQYTQRTAQLKEQYFDFTPSYGADKYYNAAYHRVQLGNTMYVTVTVKTDIRGLGVFKIPVTLTVTRSGLSQRYWK